MNLFFDTEFTGLQKSTTLISIGIVAQTGQTFYAELNDYDDSQVDDWIRKNVIEKLMFIDIENIDLPDPNGKDYKCKGNKNSVRDSLQKWLSQFGDAQIRMWADVLAYDWVLFCDLFGGAMSIPKNIFYIPFDISTLLLEKIGSADINREEFVGPEQMGKICGFLKTTAQSGNHNALFDAMVLRACHVKLSRI